jgi:hypothetical protein
MNQVAVIFGVRFCAFCVPLFFSETSPGQRDIFERFNPLRATLLLMLVKKVTSGEGY